MKNLSVEDPGTPGRAQWNKAIRKSRLLLICVPFLLACAPAEAIHLGSLIAAHGYIFPISDHVLTLKDDGTLYRFQVTP